MKSEAPRVKLPGSLSKLPRFSVQRESSTSGKDALTKLVDEFEVRERSIASGRWQDR